jgi:dTDP-4-amino-4,6-dideoxygalactose transaminase
MTIKIGDFKITQRQKDIVNEIMDSGRLTEGPYVKKLERIMEKYLNVKHAILTTNGTVSLQLIAHTFPYKLNICVPALTFPATINAFLLMNHNIILCDVGEDLQIDIDTLTKQQKEDIDVIVPVHLLGYSANMEKILKAKRKYGWIVIEDTAEAFGAEYKGTKVGTIGDFGSFSFYMSHNIGCGELGMVVTNDDVVNSWMRSMKNHGRIGDPLKFLHHYHGSNYKTTEFMAGICYANMEEVDVILNQRLENAKYFHDNVKNVHLENFPIIEGMSPLGYCFKCDTEEYKDEVCKKLNDNGVETRDMFPCLANQIAYKGMFDVKKYPVADRLEKTIFYVGVHQYLTHADKLKIVKLLGEEDN